MIFTTLIDRDMSVAANFHAMWGGFFDANLQTGGWVYTAQTGDINPNTVAVPAPGANAGFRCYKSNDGLTDFYLKITYGLGAYNSKGLRLIYQIGTTVDGSGGLGGQVGTAQTIESNNSGSGTARHYMSVDTGRVSWLLSGNGAADSFLVSIGRTVDSTGAPSATSIESWQGPMSYAGICLAQDVVLTGSVLPVESGSRWPAVFTAASPSTYGTAIAFALPQLIGESGGRNPTLCVGITDGSTLTVGTTVTLPIYGTTHTFLVTGVVGVSAMNAAHRALMRYE